MKKAPTFKTTDYLGNEISSEILAGSKYLIYFYPKDMTPGCTIEAIGFQEKYAEFKEAGVQIFGVSKDSAASHQKFCDKHDLRFPLLVDTDATIAQAFGVLKEKSMFGKKYMGISRESFLVDEKGNILKHWEKVKPVSHPKEVLDFVKSL